MSDARDAAPPPPAHTETPRRGSELATRAASAVVLGLAALLVAWIGGYAFLVFWSVAAIAVWWEWLGIVNAAQRRLLTGVGAVAFVGMATSLAAGTPAFAFVSVLIGGAVAVSAAQGRKLWVGAGIVYAAAALIPAVMLRADPEFGLVAILWLFAVVWTEDTAAYFTGRFFGGPKLAPAISPGKTWSGAAGGAIGGLSAGMAIIHLAGIDLHPLHAVLTLAVAVAAQCGDLLESWIKRRFTVKDASRLLPGHGGVMDRLDGFLFAALLVLVVGVVLGGASSPAAGVLAW